MDIILENFRSFKKRVQIPLKPLTFLVGENSSGKSSFLAATSILLDESFRLFKPNFNNPPYNLGSFDTILSNGADIDKELFTLGSDQNGSLAIASYGKDQADILLKRVELKRNSTWVDIKFTGEKFVGEYSNNGKSQRIQSQVFSNFPFDSGLNVALINATGAKNLPQFLRGIGYSAYSFAPIRSKPRRTYDESSPPPDPEGGHIPWVLYRYLQESKTAQAIPIIKAIEDFGRESGLFRKIKIKKLGRSSSEPFQIQVLDSGKPVNLLDVGYGVSQALPIIVESLLKSPKTALLLQQPEVHLHPKAQAALGTFFAKLVNGTDRLVLIETHSDYMLDRVRREVADGTIDSEKVQILYFQKFKGNTDVYPIQIDSVGNIVNPPPHYRDFFLREQMSLFHRGRK